MLEAKPGETSPLDFLLTTGAAWGDGLSFARRLEPGLAGAPLGMETAARDPRPAHLPAPGWAEMTWKRCQL